MDAHGRRSGRSPRFAVALASAVVVSSVMGVASAQSYGDFNGDGYDDLAIGIPSKDEDSGAVSVMYGSATGLATTGNALLGRAPVIPVAIELEGTAAANDRLGFSLAIGDFDDDGYDDLAIGCPFDDVATQSGTASNAGSINVVYGSAAGLDEARNRLWHQGSMPDVLGVAETNEEFGHSLAAGDFDGDGIDDLAVGVPRETAPFTPDGTIHVFYGAALTGLSGARDQVVPSVDTFGSFRFAHSLAAGDFDGDGRDDIAIGIPHRPRLGETLNQAGGVAVEFGGPLGIDSGRRQMIFPSSIGAPPGGFDRFGSVLAVGDVNADGAADLAIGVPDLDDESIGTIDSGAVYLLFGQIGGAVRTDNAQFLAPDPASGTPETADRFGASLSMGHLTSDLRADLIVGAPGDNEAKGAIHAYRGGAAGLTPLRFVRAKVEGGARGGDAFGSAIAIADFDGNISRDVVVGVPGDDVLMPWMVLADAGTITVFSGTSIRTFHHTYSNVDDTEAGAEFGAVFGGEWRQ